MEGYTENIRVISIVGRYLEHSRIYLFGAEEETAKVYIASADFMTRNTTKRVEVAAPVWDKAIKERIMDMFHLMLKDNVKARELGSDGCFDQFVNDDLIRQCIHLCTDISRFSLFGFFNLLINHGKYLALQTLRCD